MYIDIIIIVLLIAFVIFYFRRFSNFVYLIGILDLFFRLMYFLRVNLAVKEIQKLLAYLPTSLFAVLSKYTKGIFYDILAWGLFIILMIFLGYVLKTFIKRKK